MITSLPNDAVERVPLAQLLPGRSQSRIASVDGPALSITLIDSLSLGTVADGEAYIAIIGVEERVIVVPGVLRDGELVRNPGVGSLLRHGQHGNFEVELFSAAIPGGTVRELNVDQSNDSVIVAESVMVKWQLDAVISPAPESLRALNGLGITPQLRAIVKWTPNTGDQRTVLTAVEYLPRASDGWTWAVELVRAHALGESVDPIKPFITLGEMTAQLHSALAQGGVTHSTRTDLAELHAQSIADLRQAISLIGGLEGERLRARASNIEAQLQDLRSIESTPTIRIHGDFHIGQVLRAPREEGDHFTIVDFDGSPVLSPAKRMLPAPAARDVAGMLASIDHVARVVNYRTQGVDPLLAIRWIRQAQQAFVESYESALSRAGDNKIFDSRLITPLIINQECREFIYAAEYLPHWRYVPDAVLTDMFPKEN